jgi:hypothetical protein
MTRNNHILQELQELQSGLAGIQTVPVYQVPANYFEGLVTEVLRRIKAEQATTVAEELSHLSPLLSTIKKETPYSIPADYFDTLQPVLVQIENTADELSTLSPLLSGLKKEMPFTVPENYFETTIPVFYTEQSVTEELESLSPTLNSISKKMPYSVPVGYFENLVATPVQEKQAPAKVVSLGSRKWFRYAAAAVVIGFVAVSGFFFFNRTNNTVTGEGGAVAEVIKKVSAEKIDQFVEMTASETDELAQVDTKAEVNTLMKDVSDKEIQEFLADTQSGEPENSDDLILN